MRSDSHVTVEETQRGGAGIAREGHFGAAMWKSRVVREAGSCRCIGEGRMDQGVSHSLEGEGGVLGKL